MTEPTLVCWSDLCGTELYAGSFCYRLEGMCICPDCLKVYATKYFRTALELVL